MCAYWECSVVEVLLMFAFLSSHRFKGDEDDMTPLAGEMELLRQSLTVLLRMNNMRVT